MSTKKGSLIRRLAEERREKETDSGEGKSQVFSIPIVPPAPETSPDPVDRPMTLGAPAEPQPAVPQAPTKDEAPSVGKGTPSDGTSQPGEPSKPSKEKPPRLARLPGRQRGRKSESCARHPGEAKRTAGARTWLTPEENEKLELLAMAYQVSTSTLTRDILLEGLDAHKDLIEKTRRFMDSLRRSSA